MHINLVQCTTIFWFCLAAYLTHFDAPSLMTKGANSVYLMISNDDVDASVLNGFVRLSFAQERMLFGGFMPAMETRVVHKGQLHR